jgi:citrate synthase
MQETCKEVLHEMGLENDPLFKLAMVLEKIALEDDLLSFPTLTSISLGIVQRAIGIPCAAVHRVRAGAYGWLDRTTE